MSRRAVSHEGGRPVGRGPGGTSSRRKDAASSRVIEGISDEFQLSGGPLYDMFDGNRIEPSPWMAADLKEHLIRLQAERALASLEGLGGNKAYASDLDDDLAAAHHAYVGAAVTEIATLRAELSDPQVG